MPSTKRSAEDGPATRSSKVAKTDSGSTPSKAKKGGAKKGAKALPTSTFKSQALPLHVNLTHTPPSIADADTVPAAPLDPGYLGGLTLIPTSFATGSYGWKGSHRLTIELMNPEGGKKEKVSVMLNINATVMGSKGAKEDDEKEEKGEEPAEAEAEAEAED
ncbi:hypothetical protein DFH09DRAFT_1187465 [Mycena vulgaris]|nr:hypothetical protein DFH09DRAFT_1187465 [Mycena vulgaris]